MDFKGITVSFRHRLVRLIAPKLYEEMRGSLDSVPRPMTVYLKSLNRNRLVGAEIGVASGVNAESLLRELPMEKLFLIDPHIENARQRLHSYMQAQFIGKYSADAALSFQRESLDFVYIDGSHEYKCVKEDIQLYFPLVKAGGVLGGHDYTDGCSGVVKAVNEFGVAHGLSVCHVWPDWWYG